MRGFTQPIGETAQARLRSLTTTFTVVNNKVESAESATDHRRFYLDENKTRDEVFKSSYQGERKSASVYLPGELMQVTDEESNLNLVSGHWTITTRRQKCVYAPNDKIVAKWVPILKNSAQKFEIQFRETLRAEELAEACTGSVKECEQLDVEAERLVTDRETLWNNLIKDLKVNLK